MQIMKITTNQAMGGTLPQYFPPAGAQRSCPETNSTRVKKKDAGSSSPRVALSSQCDATCQGTRTPTHPEKFRKMSATSTQFWKQASPRSRICVRPLSVMTSPLGFTITSLGMVVMWYLALSSLRREEGGLHQLWKAATPI